MEGGDERAATELVERHASALARFAVSLGERTEVDELVQDTFVRAFEFTRRISRRQLVPNVVVHDSTAIAAGPPAQRAEKRRRTRTRSRKTMQRPNSMRSMRGRG